MKMSTKMHHRKEHQLLLLYFLYMYFFTGPVLTSSEGENHTYNAVFLYD